MWKLPSMLSLEAYVPKDKEFRSIDVLMVFHVSQIAITLDKTTAYLGRQLHHG